MGTHFIFSANPLKPTVVEDMFADQDKALQAAGFSTSVCPDAVIGDRKPLRNVPSGATVVYRGWMLKEVEYSRFVDAVKSASAIPLTPVSSYLAAHHLPNWYPHIAQFTPETRVLSSTADIEGELRSLGWGSFFIKDYVKSLKASRGAIIREPSEIRPLLAEMKEFRGEIEGGICVRRVEPFVAESERRFFVLNGKVYGPSEESVPEIVELVAASIPSRFFSVDIIRRTDDVIRVVEVGDGQVSDLVGWTAQKFAAMWIADRSSA
jgi:hypothetical protein